MNSTNIISHTEFPVNDQITWVFDREPDRSVMNMLNNNLDNIDVIYNDYNNFIYNYYNINQNVVSEEILPKKKICVACEPLEITEEERSCSLCMEPREKVEICRFGCGHYSCGTCVESCMKKFREFNCPFCREQVVSVTAQTAEIKDTLNQFCDFQI
jgi:hypothetical protein